MPSLPAVVSRSFIIATVMRTAIAGQAAVLYVRSKSNEPFLAAKMRRQWEASGDTRVITNCQARQREGDSGQCWCQIQPRETRLRQRLVTPTSSTEVSARFFYSLCVLPDRPCATDLGSSSLNGQNINHQSSRILETGPLLAFASPSTVIVIMNAAACVYGRD